MGGRVREWGGIKKELQGKGGGSSWGRRQRWLRLIKNGVRLEPALLLLLVVVIEGEEREESMLWRGGGGEEGKGRDGSKRPNAVFYFRHKND